MARSKSRTGSNEREPQRFANRQVARALTTPSPYLALNLVQDLRTWDPQPHLRSPLTIDGAKFELKAHTPSSKSKARTRRLLPHAVGFAEPHRLMLCIRRKRRKEVLFAKRKTRRGSGSKKRRNQFSHIRC